MAPQSNLSCLGRSSKGQHSAPRGGPPRSWTNDDLTKALENVWNKRMTTSQASRIFGIPYNSLLMYVRGKYGKSLRLDVLKKNTPAANDDLNVIGNSRSTPKEKAAGVKKEDGYGKDRGRKPSQESGIGGPLSGLFPNFAEGHSFNPFSNGLLFPPPGEPSFPGLLGFPPSDPRIKELMQSLQAQHSALSQTERIKEESFSDTKENNENGSKSGFQAAPLYMQDEAREKALAALLQGCRRAREDCQEKTQETQSSEPKSDEDKESKEEEARTKAAHVASLFRELSRSRSKIPKNIQIRI